MMDYQRLDSLKSVSILAMVTLFVFTTTPAFAQRSSSGLSQGMTNDAGEEIVSRIRGFAAVVTLDDSGLNSLLEKGSLEIPIPHQLVNSIDSVLIKRPIYFKDRLVAEFANATLVRKQLVVDIDDKILERIDYQPIDLKVYETGFDRIVLRYVGLSKGRSNAKSVGDPQTDSPVLLVKLKSGKGIRGRIKGLKSFMLDSAFGAIEVAIDATRKIEAGQDNSLTVVMQNGDRITGKVDFEKIELLTLWENETIALTGIESIEAGEGKQTLRTGKDRNRVHADR